MSTTYIRVYDLTQATHLSGRVIKNLVEEGIITADANLMHGQRFAPLFKEERFNDLVCKLLIYAEQRKMTKKKAEALISTPRGYVRDENGHLKWDGVSFVD
jgi:hypothetical protein